MLKVRYLILINLFLLTSLFIYAEDQEDNLSGFEIRGGVIGAASISSGFTVPEVAVFYKPSAFGVGVGFRSYFGFAYDEIYLTPYASGEFAWLSVKVGASIRIKEPNGGVYSHDRGTSFFAAADLYPSFPLGPGQIYFGSGMSVFSSASAVTESDSILGTLIGSGIVAVMNLVKLEVGVGYKLQL